MTQQNLSRAKREGGIRIRLGTLNQINLSLQSYNDSLASFSITKTPFIHSKYIFSEFADLDISYSFHSDTEPTVCFKVLKCSVTILFFYWPPLSPSCFRSLLRPTLPLQSSLSKTFHSKKWPTRKVRACAKLAVEVIIWARIKLLFRDYRPKVLLLFFGLQKMMKQLRS